MQNSRHGEAFGASKECGDNLRSYIAHACIAMFHHDTRVHPRDITVIETLNPDNTELPEGYVLDCGERKVTGPSEAIRGNCSTIQVKANFWERRVLARSMFFGALPQELYLLRDIIPIDLNSWRFCLCFGTALDPRENVRHFGRGGVTDQLEYSTGNLFCRGDGDVGSNLAGLSLSTSIMKMPSCHMA
ncbi:hypothetical protein BS47DRAFT_1394390 [Hydnum rufescens UP504]|uniref:Uncharacterized protein n=1 Tax=Hydnum rufescens UP504 TaxID=1448309 RepID=A0A9P6AUP1_9AGAM|nr:hypothetical protein BS47DRAFT_1394390 [Hydnum rufescens UP504]